MLYNSAGGQGGFVIHLNAAGNFAFAKPIRPGFLTTGQYPSLVTGRRGGVFLGGTVTSAVDINGGQAPGPIALRGSFDLLPAKWDNSGSLQYATGFGSSGEAVQGNVAVGLNGAIYLAGMTSGTVDLDPGPGTATVSVPPISNALFLARYKDANTVGIAPQPTQAPKIEILAGDGCVLIDYSSCGSVNASVTVYDVSGRTILRSGYRRNDMQRLDLGNAAPGVYIVRVSSGGARTAQRIVVR